MIRLNRRRRCLISFLASFSVSLGISGGGFPLGSFRCLSLSPFNHNKLNHFSSSGLWSNCVLPCLWSSFSLETSIVTQTKDDGANNQTTKCKSHFVHSMPLSLVAFSCLVLLGAGIRSGVYLEEKGRRRWWRKRGKGWKNKWRNQNSKSPDAHFWTEGSCSLNSCFEKKFYGFD